MLYGSKNFYTAGTWVYEKMSCVSELNSVWCIWYTYGICSFESTTFLVILSLAALFIVSCNDKEMDRLRINECHMYQMYMKTSAFVLCITKTPLRIHVKVVQQTSSYSQQLLSSFCINSSQTLKQKLLMTQWQNLRCMRAALLLLTEK